LAAGINVRDRLLQFHEQFYSSNQMSLCVSGKQSLDVLENWVKAKFSKVPDKNAEEPALQWWGKIAPYDDSDDSQPFATELQIVPISENIRSLSLSWPIWIRSPEQRQQLIASKPEQVISHLLGHEGKGSIRSLLVSKGKTCSTCSTADSINSTDHLSLSLCLLFHQMLLKKGWANGISASIGLDVSDLQVFEVQIDLTEEGLKHRYDIVDIVFAYINMIASPSPSRSTSSGISSGTSSGTSSGISSTSPNIPPYIFQEVEQLSRIAFAFAEKLDPISTVSSVVTDLRNYAPDQYLVGPHIYRANMTAAAEYMSFLVPEQLRIKTVSSAFKGKTSGFGDWYGTEYNLVSLPRQTTAWRATLQSKSGSKSGSGGYPIGLPPPNELIPTKYSPLLYFMTIRQRHISLDYVLLYM
jgi:insulysin